jgi:indolepyruvate ferredoxin oxidoreductase
MAQKGGGVFSHIRIGAPGELLSPRIGAAQADLLLGADLVVAHGKAALPACGNDRTVAVVDAKVAPTAEFVRNNAVQYDRAGMLKRLARNCRRVDQVDAASVVTAALGDAIYANIFLLGHAWQNGLVPLSLAAIEHAIALNGVDVEKNRQAFALGRRAAVEPVKLDAPVAESLDALIDRRAALLTAYQDESYAEAYRRFVARVREAERPLGRDALTRAVARGLHKLMAYKDEYEVARLYTDGAFAAALRQQFEGDVRLELHLAPPLLTMRDADGKPVKRRFGPWMLAAMRGLARCKHPLRRVRLHRRARHGAGADRRAP